ncbi:MAG: cobalamin-dependent protein [Planctomycetota bacterium]
MDAQGTVIADWLLATRRVLAHGAAERLSTASASVIAALTNDLDNLAAALAVGRDELFDDHVAWSLAAGASDDVDEPRCAARLAALRDELEVSVPGTARTRVAAVLTRGIDMARRPAIRQPPSFPPAGPHQELAARYLLAILEARTQDAHDLLLRALHDGADGPSLLHHVLLPAQAELGRMWQCGEIDIATEHLGSRVAERIAAVIHAQGPRSASNGRRVMVAAVGGNQHDLASRLLADALERRGYVALLLGADTPPIDLAEAAAHARVDAVALSVALGTQVRIAELTVRALRSLRETAHVKVIVGGGPFTRIDDLWRDIGADASAPDLDGAVAAIEALLSS